MKKNLITGLLGLLISPMCLFAQQEGIQLQRQTSWSTILEKAKKEHKFIFLDAYTSWCGPCKYMTDNIFPLKEVGDFFNSNFISVQMQLDKTKGDNDNVKFSYKDADSLGKAYNIKVYPTFLFFDSDGKVLHRTTGAAPAEIFISRAKEALDPASQYYTLLRRLETNPTDTSVLRKLALHAQSMREDAMAAKLSEKYLSLVPDIYTKDIIKFMLALTIDSKSKNFPVFLNQGHKIDSVMGKGTTVRKIMEIAIEEEDFRISGESKQMPNWIKIRPELEKKYPGYGTRITLNLQINYDVTTKRWTDLVRSVNIYNEKYNWGLAPNELNWIAGEVFENCEDPKVVNNALNWVKHSRDAAKQSLELIYIDLLYKSGHKAESLRIAEGMKNMIMMGNPDYFRNLISKMKKGEKTWGQTSGH